MVSAAFFVARAHSTLLDKYEREKGAKSESLLEYILPLSLALTLTRYESVASRLPLPPNKQTPISLHTHFFDTLESKVTERNDGLSANGEELFCRGRGRGDVSEEN